MTLTQASYLDQAFTDRGLARWRRHYLRFLRDMDDVAVLDVGAGSPDFLRALPARRRVALDIGERYREAFEAAGVEFAARDIERDPIDDLGRFDVAICSDVFEHLFDPRAALERIADALTPGGVLFAHVPNEFTAGHVLRVMLGRGESLAFHKGQEEWTDPHLRRFTDVGFRKFLALRFRHALPIHDLARRKWARRLAWLSGSVPYCMDPGPTYIATNDDGALHRFARIKREVAAERRNKGRPAPPS